MIDDLSARRQDAARRNYATDANIRKRAALFDHAMPGDPQPQLWDLFDWPADSTVLDVGCGNGFWTTMAAHRTPDGVVIGLDRSPGMVGAVAALPEPIQPVLGDGHRLPVRSGSVDVVLATFVLYHLSDKQEALSEMKRVLRPGGRLIAATNSADHLPPVGDTIGRCVRAVAGYSVDRWIEALDFTLENGEAVLRPWFDRIETHRSDATFQVTEPEPLIAYAESLRDPMVAELGDQFDFDAFLATFAAAVVAEAAAGPVTFTRRSAYFVAHA